MSEKSNKPEDLGKPKKTSIKRRLNSVEYYVLKVILIAATAIGGITLLVFAIIHAWKFLHAAMM